ncbi:hypothetical protein PENTCL1PPCAC_19132, partial [Pristionchus entomophagus]
VIKSQKNNETMIDSDEDSEPAVKKAKAESEKNKKDKKRSTCKREDNPSIRKDRQVDKPNDSELECPECEYRTQCAGTWMSHLRIKHSTTPVLAGFALLCECGNESVSDAHARMCNIANFTIIHKRDGPIRRMNDAKTTPQCVLCEFYPKTASGYISHLHVHHKSTLFANGVYLSCECGLNIRSSMGIKHDKECNRRQFSLHKLNEK